MRDHARHACPCSRRRSGVSETLGARVDAGSMGVTLIADLEIVET